MKANGGNRSANPFGPTRYGYLFETLASEAPGHHLDYGCFDGAVLMQLKRAELIKTGIGVDLNADALPKTSIGETDLRFECIQNHEVDLPRLVPPASLDSISLLDVLEHIHDQSSLLISLARLLKPGGRLIVTVPKQHAFSLIDGGNFKFRFPRTHKWLYLRRHSPNDYHHRYVENPFGLVGDVEKAKSWHQHFAEAELCELLNSCGFAPTDLDGAGLFHRPLVYMKHLRLPVETLIDRDLRRFSSCHLFATAIRRPEISPTDKQPLEPVER